MRPDFYETPPGTSWKIATKNTISLGVAMEEKGSWLLRLSGKGGSLELTIYFFCAPHAAEQWGGVVECAGQKNRQLQADQADPVSSPGSAENRLAWG